MTERCFLAGREIVGGQPPDFCWGRMDPAHLIPKNAIRRELKRWTRTEGIVWDPRVIVPVCRGHHANWDNCRITLAREELPKAVWEFATEYDPLTPTGRALTSRLERDYPEAT